MSTVVCQFPGIRRARSVKHLRLKVQPRLGRYPAIDRLREETARRFDPNRSKNSSDLPFGQPLAPRGTAPPTPLLLSLLTPIEPNFDPSVDPSSLHEPLQLALTEFPANRHKPAHFHRSPPLKAIQDDSSRTPFHSAHSWFDPVDEPNQATSDRPPTLAETRPCCKCRSPLEPRFR